MNMRAILRGLVPPFVHRALSAVRRSRTRFDGDFRSWEDALSASKGYDDSLVIEAVIRAGRIVKSGKAHHERDSVLFSSANHDYFVATAVLLACASADGVCHVLDFGGALASVYHQNREIFGHAAGLEWTVVEQPAFVEAGRREFSGNTVRFESSVDEACAANGPPSLMLLSSVLQYMQRPYDVFGDLLDRSAPVVCVDRMPFHTRKGDRLTVQRVPESIYRASYPAWLLDEQKLTSHATKRGYELVSRWVDEEVRGNHRYGGLLFVHNNAAT